MRHCDASGLARASRRGRLEGAHAILARERLVSQIMQRAVSLGLGAASAREIDRINIYHASTLAMRRALVASQRVARSRAHRWPPDSLTRRRASRHRRRRRQVLQHRVRFDRGEGDARPAHGESRATASALRVGSQLRLRNTSSHRRTAVARQLRASSTIVRRESARARRHGARSHRKCGRTSQIIRFRGRRRFIVMIAMRGE